MELGLTIQQQRHILDPRFLSSRKAEKKETGNI